MEVSFSYQQVSGRPVENKSINQHKNLGGLTPGFVTDFFSAEDNSGCGRLIFTTATVDSEAALFAATDKALLMLLEGQFARKPILQSVINRRFRGIIAEA